MFNGRQRLRLFPTPTDADGLHVRSGGVQPAQRLAMWPGLSQVTLPFTLNLALGRATGVAPLEEDEQKAKEAKLHISGWTCTVMFNLHGNFVRCYGPCFTGGETEVPRDYIFCSG